MKFTLVLILFFLTTLVHSSELTKSIKPQVLRSLDWDKKLSLNEINDALGKPSLEENNIRYYEYKGMKYPLSIEISSKKVKRIFSLYRGQEITLQEIGKYLKDFTKEEAKGKSAEIYYYMVSQDKKLKLKFKLGDHSLYSVERWY